VTTPYWMSTKLGQWLARNVEFFARLWRTEMRRAHALRLRTQLSIFESSAAAHAEVAFLDRGHACPSEGLMIAVCQSRNARDALSNMELEECSK
jgi:hypothetical protein